MPKPKRSLKIFLCHAHADFEQVRDLYFRLTKDGIDAWLDKENLLPGQDWEKAIRKAIDETDIVLVCLSKKFNQTGFRQKEVRFALDQADKRPEGEIFIIPTKLEKCENLESLRKWHWVDLFDDDGYERLMRTLVTRAKEIKAFLPLSKNNNSQKYSEIISTSTFKESLLLSISPLNEIYKAPIEINCPENIFLSLWVKHALLEIAKEAILNAIIHAGSYKKPDFKIAVNVDVRNNGRDLELSISDSGAGFDSVSVGTGIFRMKSLADYLNQKDETTLSISSEPNKGTKVVLKMSFSSSIFAVNSNR